MKKRDAPKENGVSLYNFIKNINFAVDASE